MMTFERDRDPHRPSAFGALTDTATDDPHNGLAMYLDMVPNPPDIGPDDHRYG